VKSSIARPQHAQQQPAHTHPTPHTITTLARGGGTEAEASSSAAAAVAATDLRWCSLRLPAAPAGCCSPAALPVAVAVAVAVGHGSCCTAAR